MPRKNIHNATITVKLPFDLGAGAEVAALRAAGIPVDALGNAEQGFLFVRFGDGWKNQANIFRWFACAVQPAESAGSKPGQQVPRPQQQRHRREPAPRFSAS